MKDWKKKWGLSNTDVKKAVTTAVLLSFVIGFIMVGINFLGSRTDAKKYADDLVYIKEIGNGKSYQYSKETGIIYIVNPSEGTRNVYYVDNDNDGLVEPAIIGLTPLP